MSNNDVKKSVVSLVLLVTGCVVLGATGDVSKFAAGSFHVLLGLSLAFLVLVLFVLWVTHFVSVFRDAEKMAHIAMFVLIPMTILTVFPLTRKWENYEHRRWFFAKALPEYQAAVDKIMTDSSVLKDQGRLQLLIGHPAGCPYVHGEIKSDGSVVIFFSGGDHWREGYVYSSAGQMNGDAYSYITNGWSQY